MLIKVDNRPIRRFYTARLRRARRAVARLEAQIARYDQVDGPAFYLWYHREFGPVLAHHRGLREQIAALEFVQSDPDAEKSEVVNDWAKAAENVPENDDQAQDSWRDATELADEFALATKEPHRECQRLFRRIAMQLHPDRGGPLVGERKLWWLQAQSAYESGDLVALQLILFAMRTNPANHRHVVRRDFAFDSSNPEPSRGVARFTHTFAARTWLAFHGQERSDPGITSDPFGARAGADRAGTH